VVAAADDDDFGRVGEEVAEAGSANDNHAAGKES
jgi:hypothetical protein